MSVTTLIGCLVLGAAFAALSAAVILGIGAVISAFSKTSDPESDAEEQPSEPNEE